MNLNTKQFKFSKYLAKLILFAIELGYDVVVAEVYRSPEEQRRHYEKGRTKTLNSKHMQKLAVDLIIFRNREYLTLSDDYKQLGYYWKSLDTKNVWGGDWEEFPDGNHFQYTK